MSTFYHFNCKELKACHGNSPTKHYLGRLNNCETVKAMKFFCSQRTHTASHYTLELVKVLAILLCIG